MNVGWHRRARIDLAEIIDHIAIENFDAAVRLRNEFFQQTAVLGRHPEMGRLGRIPGTRELVISGTAYIAPYRITGKAVTILRLIHGARRWPRKL